MDEYVVIDRATLEEAGATIAALALTVSTLEAAIEERDQIAIERDAALAALAELRQECREAATTLTQLASHIDVCPDEYDDCPYCAVVRPLLRKVKHYAAKWQGEAMATARQQMADEDRHAGDCLCGPDDD